MFIYKYVPFPCNFFRPLICPQIVSGQPGSIPLAGSTGQQTVGRMNQVAGIFMAATTSALSQVSTMVMIVTG